MKQNQYVNKLILIEYFILQINANTINFGKNICVPWFVTFFSFKSLYLETEIVGI